MKITIGFKTPDAIHYALEEYRDYGEDEHVDGRELSDDEKEELTDKLKRWIQYGESITVEFDLDKMKAKVIER